MSSPGTVKERGSQPKRVIQLPAEGNTFFSQLYRTGLIILQTRQARELAQCFGSRGQHSLPRLMSKWYLQSRSQPATRFSQVALPLPVVPEGRGQAQGQFNSKQSCAGIAFHR